MTCGLTVALSRRLLHRHPPTALPMGKRACRPRMGPKGSGHSQTCRKQPVQHNSKRSPLPMLYKRTTAFAATKSYHQPRLCLKWKATPLAFCPPINRWRQTKTQHVLGTVTCRVITVCWRCVHRRQMLYWSCHWWVQRGWGPQGLPSTPHHRMNPTAKAPPRPTGGAPIKAPPQEKWPNNSNCVSCCAVKSCTIRL